MDQPINSNQQSHYLSLEQRSFIVFSYREGKSYGTIRKDFLTKYQRTIYDSTISALVKKEGERGSVKDLSKPGRPLTYDEREERSLVRYATQHPHESLRDLQMDIEANPKGASKDTLSRVFEKHNVVSRVLSGRMADLTAPQVKTRKKFAESHLEWSFEDWEYIIFSDEADLLPTKCGKEYIRLRRSQDPLRVVVPGQAVQRDLTIKVWGAISFLGVGPLVRYEGTMDSPKYLETLEGHLLQAYPFL